MAFSWETRQTASGARYVRSVASGEVTVDEAFAMRALVSPGGALHETPVMVVNEKGLHTISEVRKILADTLGRMTVPFAMVVRSAPTRVALSFMLRISGKSVEHTKFFAEESAAAEWLATQAA